MDAAREMRGGGIGAELIGERLDQETADVREFNQRFAKTAASRLQKFVGKLFGGDVNIAELMGMEEGPTQQVVPGAAGGAGVGGPALQLSGKLILETDGGVRIGTIDASGAVATPITTK